MRSIPTTKSTTTSSLSPSPSSSTAPSSSLTSSDMHSTTWHSPIPYLFGGLAAMLGLIAFALLILACSYWKLSVQHDDEETGSNNTNRNMEGKEHGDSSNKGTVKVYEENILVIMAGDEKPTFLATPACAKCSSLADDGVGNHSDKDIENHDKTLEKSEKEMNNNNNPRVLQATTLLSTQQPQPQETAQQQQNQLQ